MLPSPDIEVSKDDTIQDLHTGGQTYSKREPQVLAEDKLRFEVLAEDKLRFEVFVLLTERGFGRKLRGGLYLCFRLSCLS
jgi:hypothetical protein